MRYRLYIFDLDGTLARSKTPINHEVAHLLKKLLDDHIVAIITGSKFSSFTNQVLPFLDSDANLENLIILPTSGAEYYVFQSGKWQKLYSEKLNSTQKKQIIDALHRVLNKLKINPEVIYGDIIEDRDTQITYSALGQDCPVDIKEKWDPDQSKRRVICDELKKLIPNYKITIGGTTSIDVTLPYLDKEYGVRKIIEKTKMDPREVLFFGDKLQEGGNDSPVTRTGVKCISVIDPQDTIMKVRRFLEHENL